MTSRGAIQLFTPTGGLGYNTAVEDAVNPGWKLASVLQGKAPNSLLDSYEAERKPLAQRNTGYARQFADSIGLFAAGSCLDDGRSRYDLFHSEWTLLALGATPPSTGAFEQAAGKLGLDLRIVLLRARSTNAACPPRPPVRDRRPTAS